MSKPTNDQLWAALKQLDRDECGMVFARLIGYMDAWEAYYPEAHGRLRDALASSGEVSRKLEGAQ